jgi:hypothetical protein
MSVTVPPFTTIDEITDIFSQDAVDLRTDDLTDPIISAAAMARLIADATNIIYQYTWLIYNVTDLSNSDWVRTRASYIACYLVSMRRGNPGQYIDRYNSILEELKLIMSRDLYIPGLNITQRQRQRFQIRFSTTAALVRSYATRLRTRSVLTTVNELRTPSPIQM